MSVRDISVLAKITPARWSEASTPVLEGRTSMVSCIYKYYTRTSSSYYASQFLQDDT